MANQTYDQLGDLVTNQILNWSTGIIRALLVEGVTFTASDTKLSAVASGVTPKRDYPIQGRRMNGSDCLGYPALYEDTPKNTVFQVLLAQSDGMGDADLLAFIDEDELGGDLTVVNPGTLIVRPQYTAAPGTPPEVGVWLRI